MLRRSCRAPLLRTLVAAAATVAVAAPARAHTPPVAARTAGYDALVAFFTQWRAFQRAPVTNGAPDYSPAAMARQARALVGMQRRLAAMDTTGWTIPQRVDWHIVRAEMAGLEFDHRVRKPWANNPAFYVTVFADQSDQPAREGTWADGAIEVWAQSFPLDAASATDMRTKLRAIPVLLQQARTNLTGNGADLWKYAVGTIREQVDVLAALSSKVPSELQGDVEKARAATEAYATWVAAQAPRKTGPSGVGIANYDWYLKHVMLVPYTWAQEVSIMERELARSTALMALEERKNAAVPQPVPVGSQEEFTRRYDEGLREYMAFLSSHDVISIRPDMEPALRAQLGRFIPGPREFFYEVDYRDPEIMRTHGFHWFDLAYMKNTPHASPIRRGPLLYNTFVTRTEGHATGWEELMLQMGMFDGKPHSRELIYILLAERAARAMGDLRMHANQMTLEQASAYASKYTPRDYLRLDGKLVRGEQHLYLQQPGYGTSYVIGKIQIEGIIAERRRQLGEGFLFKPFMDQFTATGLIPAALVEWEMTGVMPEQLR